MLINKLKTKSNRFFLTEWFQIQNELTTPFEDISPQELKQKCLQEFYLSARKRDGRSVIAR